jgi:hypothetical protein
VYYTIFLDFVYISKNKKEVKKQKQEKKECFANLKEQEDSQWCNLPKLTKLHDARKTVAASENSLRLRKFASVNAFLCSLTTVPENSLDDTKQCATSLGLQVKSVVARVNFPHEGTWSLYRTLRESQKSSLRSRQTTCKTISLYCVPNSTEWLSSTSC